MGDVIAEYEIYEPDLDMLCRLIKNRSITECIVYGIGNNGIYFSKCLIANRISIKYYVDIQTQNNSRYMGKRVIHPQKLAGLYADEYIIVSPNRFDSIVSFLVELGISRKKIILPFYLREKINVNYGSAGNLVSNEIDYCTKKPSAPEVTVTSIIYNTPEKLLRRAIESVLKQKYRNFIYVIIINGATDDSYKIAREYELLDARIELINLKRNYLWTNVDLLIEVKNHLYGYYWCQIDGDDYFNDMFLYKTLSIAQENDADMVAVRTMAIAADKDYDLMKTDTSFDGKDKFWFYHGNPLCHAFGQNHIMEELARGRVSGTWWGKLWSMQVTKEYFAFLLNLSREERGCYFRLDTAMTYKMLTLCNRIYFSDKVLHYQTYLPGRTSYSNAPVEWLMSLWYVYKNIKVSFLGWYEYDIATEYIVRFLKTFMPWMMGRKNLLKNIDDSPYKKLVMDNLKELYNDDTFMEFIIERMNNEAQYRSFYETICKLVEDKRYIQSSMVELNDNEEYERIIGYGAKGKNAKKMIPRLMDTPYFPTELWDINGDDKLIKKPEIKTLTNKDIVIIFPTNAIAVNSIKNMFHDCKARIVLNKTISEWLFENGK